MQSGVSLVLRDITLTASSYNDVELVTLDGASLVMEVESYITGNNHHAGYTEYLAGIAGGIHAVNNSSVVLNGGNLTGNEVSTSYAYPFGHYNCFGGGIALDSGSSIVINSGSLDNEPDDIWTDSNDCSVVINGGAYNDLIVGGRGNIKINAGSLKGGYVGGPSLEIHSGNIESRISTSEFTMYGGKINSVAADGNVIIYNGKIASYTDSYGIYAAGDVIIHNAEITNNRYGVYSGGNITIYNGTFTGNGYGGVNARGTLTISGGTFTGNGLEYSGPSDHDFDTLAVAAGNDVIISGGTFTGNRNGIFFRKSFDLSGGLIEDNETDIIVGHETVYNTDTLLYETSRGAFTLDSAFAAKASYRPDWNWAVSGDFTMNAGQARNVTVLSGGNELWSEPAGIFTLNNGKISGQSYDALVTVGNKAVFTMNGGEISGNTLSAGAGYGVAVLKGGAFTLNNGIIKNNEGNGVSITDGVFAMTGGEISENGDFVLLRTSSIYDPDYYARFTLSNGVIKNNAGGIDVWPGSVFTMTGGVIEDNANSGVFNQGTFTLSGGTISGNTAKSGGGTYNSGTFILSGGTISGNTALWGSGVYAASGSTTIIRGNGAVDPSNVIHVGAETYAPGGLDYIYGYITLDSPLSGSGPVAKLDLSHTMPYWMNHEIIKLKDGFAGPIPTERFVLGDFVDGYLDDDITRSPMTGYTIRPDGRGSWCTADAAILSFSIAGVQGRIDGNDISVTLPHTADIGALTPLITVSDGARVSPAPGEAADFKDPVAFTVTGSDGSSRTYTVRVVLTGAVSGGGLAVIDVFTALPGGITPVINGMVISLEDAGFTGYSWYVDGVLRETGSNTINMSDYPPGPHNVALIALKNGIPYSSQAALTVQ
jgi:hypothetical protein